MARARKYVSVTGFPLVHLHYDSVAEMLAMSNAPAADWTLQHNYIRARDYVTRPECRLHWYGIIGGAPAVAEKLAHGYPEGEARVDAMRGAMIDKLPVAIGVGRRLVRGMSGDELDIHAVNRGDVGTAWSSRKRLLKKGKTSLRLCVDIGGNSGSDANAMQWRGVAAICLAEVMSKAGYAVEIVACFAVKGCNGDYGRNRRDCIVTTVVKPIANSIDRGLLAATVGLTGFFRTLGFTAICKAADQHGVEINSGLGQHLQAEGVLPVSDKITQIVVPSTVGSESAAQEWITQTVTLLQSLKGGA